MFLNKEENEIIRQRISEDDASKDHLKALAEQAITEGPWSVTYDLAPTSRGGSHDYYSEGPYWWPDSEQANGPYIRKDGEFNPDHFKQHKMNLRHLCKNVLILSSAGYHLGCKSYSDYAMDLIRTWFLDETTAMNPHLRYGQSIPGICEGRGIGMIDTIYFVELLQGVSYLELNDAYSNEIQRLRYWFADYLTWMSTSHHGLDEKTNGNNHATWWTLQVMSFAQFVGDEDRFKSASTWYKEAILPEQMARDGSFPEELGRTRSFHYSLFNLMPMVMICALADGQGEDLWGYALEDGRSIALGLKFMLPFLENPKTWEHPSIDPPETEDSILLVMVARRLKDDGYMALRKKWVNKRVLQDTTMTKMMLPLCIWPEIN